MADKKKGAKGKYGTKTPLKKFLHKYAGFICMGVGAIILAIVYFYFTSQNVFFENWACHQIQDMNTSGLSATDIIRLNEIKIECGLVPDVKAININDLINGG